MRLFNFFSARFRSFSRRVVRPCCTIPTHRREAAFMAGGTIAAAAAMTTLWCSCDLDSQRKIDSSDGTILDVPPRERAPFMNITCLEANGTKNNDDDDAPARGKVSSTENTEKLKAAFMKINVFPDISETMKALVETYPLSMRNSMCARALIQEGRIPRGSNEEWRPILIQFGKYNPDYESFRFSKSDLMHEYQRFLFLKLCFPEVPFCPSEVIDQMWHAHVLATRQYIAFCERHNKGAYLHHDPTMPYVAERYQLTKDYYEMAFGEPPKDKDIWPDDPKQKTQEPDRTVYKPGCDGMHRAYEVDPIYSWIEDYSPRGYTKKQLAEHFRIRAREYQTAWTHLRRRRLDEHRLEARQEIFRRSGDKICCARGHCWEDGEFDVFCEDCREMSAMPGEYHGGIYYGSACG